MELRWHTLVLLIAFYVVSTWSLLYLCGELDLTSRTNFIYWIIVTASTVGYGDFSPVTVPGKYVVSFYVIPFGLGLFGLAIGRLAGFAAYQWKRGVQGLKSLNYQNHILVIGWHGNRTLQLLNLLLRESESQSEGKQIILCVEKEIENPLPDKIGFVKATSFKDRSEMDRAAIADASCIIIDNPDDDLSLSTALFCNSCNRSAHIIAYFQDEQLGSLLKSHCPNVECMPSVAVEMMAKSAVDPGSSKLHHQLLAADQGMTQYSLKYEGNESISVETLFSEFKKKFDAIFIGVSDEVGGSIQLNPPLEQTIKPGLILYYIADERISAVDWGSLDV